MKALGTGHSRGVLWKDIEVFRHGGPPQLRLSGGALRRFDAMQARRSLLTITHADALAMAQVLLLTTESTAELSPSHRRHAAAASHTASRPRADRRQPSGGLPHAASRSRPSPCRQPSRAARGAPLASITNGRGESP